MYQIDNYVIFVIFQAKLSEKFPAPYTSTTLMCGMASIECGIIALGVERHMSEWSLRDGMRLFASLYAVSVLAAYLFLFCFV